MFSAELLAVAAAQFSVAVLPVCPVVSAAYAVALEPQVFAKPVADLLLTSAVPAVVADAARAAAAFVVLSAAAVRPAAVPVVSVLPALPVLHAAAVSAAEASLLHVTLAAAQLS